MSAAPKSSLPPPSTPTQQVRRRWLQGLAGAGGVALAAGTGLWAWQRWGTQPQQWAQQQDAAEQAFWALQLPGLDGQMQALRQYQGRPVLVNFWATWCPPCVRELPLLDALARQHPQVQVLGIAVDQAANVRAWLQRSPLSYPVLLAETGGVGLTRQLGNLSGGLPFSLLLGGQGQVLQRRIGEFSAEMLQSWMASIARSM